MRHCFLVLALVLSVMYTASVFATPVPFTPGDLAVYRTGDGTQTMSGFGNTVFIDEYTTTGTLVQSIHANDLTSFQGTTFDALVARGTSTAEGFMTRSANGIYLAAPGYNASSQANGQATAVVSASRTIGLVYAGGTIDLTTHMNFDVGTQFRGATTSDGKNFWAIGQLGGVAYTTFGSNGTFTSVGPATDAGRTVNIYDGQLYGSFHEGTTGSIKAVGTGLPTTAAPYANLPGVASTSLSPYNFYMCDLSSTVPGNDTLYLVDDAASAVKKYSLVGGVWTDTGTIPVTTAAKGLAGKVNGTSVQLFVTAMDTAGTGSGTLSTLTDVSGYNTTMTGANLVLATRLDGVPGAGGKFNSVTMAPAAQFSITTTPNVGVSRGVASTGTATELGAPGTPDGFNNGQVQIVGQPGNSFTVALDIERGDATTSGATPSATEIASLVAHLNDPGNQQLGRYVATDLVANPGAAPSSLPDSDFEVLLTFTGVDPTMPQYLNFDMLQDTGLDIDRLVATPEPASMGIILIGGIGLLSRRRNRRAA